MRATNLCRDADIVWVWGNATVIAEGVHLTFSVHSYYKVQTEQMLREFRYKMPSGDALSWSNDVMLCGDHALHTGNAAASLAASTERTNAAEWEKYM